MALTRDLLDAARLQAERLELHRQPLDFGAVVAEVVETYREPARIARVELAARIAEGLGVQGDRGRLGQVVANLLSNALKFTPSGGRVTVEAEARGLVAVVRVRDTGPGFEPSDLARLFQPFTQLREPSRGPGGGTALGLYISKGIVEEHGGQVWCESAGPGRGATFGFLLPLAGAAEEAAAHRSAGGGPG